jgi:uncharacterized protein involved in response to NO
MAKPLLQIIDVAPRPPVPAFALWQLGFRPFYLMASGFAALSIGLWALQFAGWLGGGYLPGPLWHAHEMLFGFTLAVIVGFLLTAGRNWSGQPTPTGLPLALLCALWLAGRLLVLSPWGLAAALVNSAFPLLAGLALARSLWAGGNRRYYFFVGLLGLLGLVQLSLHLVQLGALALPGWIGIGLGLDLVLFIMAVMAGRVVPMFTNNAVPGAKATRQPALERAALASLLALTLADALPTPAGLLAALCLLAAGLHAARWRLWQPHRTLRHPMVWVLHLGYAWIPVHLLLRALAQLGWLAPSMATHALTLGAIGGLTIGMMTRTARGHTGRAVVAGRLDTACYGLIFAAAVVRVVLPWLAPSWTTAAVLASAALWSTGFASYAVGYWPVLTRARLDGLPG